MTDYLLANRDYIIIIARSLVSRDPKHPWYEDWVAAQASLIDLAKKCQQLDSDGLTVYEASTPLQKYEFTTVARLASILQQQNTHNSSLNLGKSSLYEALSDAFSDYWSRKAKAIAKKGMIVVVVLDQKQQEIASLCDLIVETSNQLERDEEIGISLIQIGDDEATREFLSSLDNDLPLKGAKFDIVDTKYWHEVKRKSISQFLVEAIHD